MIRARKTIERLQLYRPPEEGRVAMLRLDFNENTAGCPPGVARALQRAMTPDWFTVYPEYQKARRTLARYFRVSPEELLITNGVDDAIKLICDTFVDPGDLLVTLSPTFAIYRFFHEVAGGKVRYARYDDRLQIPVSSLLAAANEDKKARWVAIANPNNPTGTLIAKRDLKILLEAAPGTLVLVDEAYFDFSGVTILPWIRRYPNLVVSRTFSKAFGLASLRIGFMFTNKRLAGLMRRSHAAYAVNGVAVRAAVEAIRNEDHVGRYARMVVENRAAFCRQLDALAIPYVPSAANFVLLRAGRRAGEIARRLRAKKILVREWSLDRYLKDYLRITVGTGPQMKRLVENLEPLRPLFAAPDGRKAWCKLAASSPTEWIS
ncbi:MAG: histidinol-phosphate transaminase [Terriglobia bacterium]